MSLRLSILDQSPVGEGRTGADALRSSVELAEQADGLGFTRYWVAEHHGSPGFAGAAPEVLAAVLLSRTQRMRIGTGGVLLPLYPAEKVAEVFGTLASVYPGRVDMGIGRAGGPAYAFPQQLEELRRLLGMAGAGAAGPGAAGHGTVTALPPAAPRLWLLGAGTGSAELAGKLGVDFAFAHFLNPAPGIAALESYRRKLPARPVQADADATGMLAVRVATAETRERAEELAQSVLLWRSRKDLGQDLPFPSPGTALRHRWTAPEAERARVRRRSLVVGAPEEVRRTLTRLAEMHGVDEIMVNSLAHDPADQLRSYRLLAEVFGTVPAAPDGVPVP